MASTELPVPVSPSPGPSTPLGYETTPRPRKKLSFKEPETFNSLKIRKPLPRLKLMHTQNSVDLSFDENPFEEENDDLDELEVKGTVVRAGASLRTSFAENSFHESLLIVNFFNPRKVVFLHLMGNR